MAAFFDTIRALSPASFIPFDEPAEFDSEFPATPASEGTLYTDLGYNPEMYGIDPPLFGEPGIVPTQPESPGYRFDGSSGWSYLTPLFTDFEGAAWPYYPSFSVAMRIKFHDAGHQTILQEYGGSYRMYLRRLATGYLAFGWIGYPSGVWRELAAVTGALAVDTAYTIGAVMTRPTGTTMSLTIYVDGVQVATQTWTDNPRGLNFEIVLNTSVSGATDPNPLDATVSGVAAWGSALSAGDMESLHELATEVPSAYSRDVDVAGEGDLEVQARSNFEDYHSTVMALDPYWYLRMNDSVGATSIASLGDYTTPASKAASGAGVAVLGEPSIIPTRPVDTCLRLGGSGFSWGIVQTAQVPSHFGDDTTFTLTMNARLKPTSITGNRFVVTDGSTSSYQYAFRLNLGVPTLIAEVGGTLRTVTAPTALVADTAYTVAITIEDDAIANTCDLAIWVDGVKVVSDSFAGLVGFVPNGVKIPVSGTDTSNPGFLGYAQGWAAWDRVLEDSALETLHERALTLAEPELPTREAAFGGSGLLAVTAVAGASHYFRAVDFSGSGHLFQFPAYQRSGVLAGSGALAVAVGALVGGETGGVHIIADGNLTVVARRVIISAMTVAILDSVLVQAPTALTVTLTEGVAETTVEFYIDGVLVWTGITDSSGSLAPTSINVPESVGAAGGHTLTATQPGASTATATFTLERDPSLNPTTMGPDAQAVDVPGAVRANGTRRWVFQDLMPGGLGSWIMPKNPAEGPLPYSERQFTTKVTTTGQPHVTEGMRVPVEWQFSGIALDEEFAEKLLAYGELNRRFYIINNRGQAFKVIVTGVDLVPRMQTNFGDSEDYIEAQWIDGHDYTVTATVLDQDWVVPA